MTEQLSRLELAKAMLEQYREKLAARTNADGTALKGYGRNVQELRAQIELLEREVAQLQSGLDTPPTPDA